MKPELVKEAIQEAMNEKRPDWREDFKEWIIQLVDFSLKAAVGEFDGEWFSQMIGIATGGSICVFYVMKIVVYSNRSTMKSIVAIMSSRGTLMMELGFILAL